MIVLPFPTLYNRGNSEQNENQCGKEEGMKRKARMKLRTIDILTGYKCDLEDRGVIPRVGKLQHLRGETYYAELRRRMHTADGVKYNKIRYLFWIDAGYHKGYALA
jgi:hypothetical protein